ncbi:inducible serine protease inhibitor 2-like [Augochlora pura]
MNGKVVAFVFMVVCCMALQASANIGPQCLLPLERGPCRANIPRYGYNPDTHKCEQFIYGGCHGNENNYRSIDMCRQYCA